MILKLTFIFACFLLTINGIYSQYTTPGTGQSYTMQQLVDASAGVVTSSGNDFLINNDITIAASDSLVVKTPLTIRTAAGYRINVSGKFISDPTDGLVVFTAQDTSSMAANFKGFRFEDADTAVFRNTVVKYGGGIQLIATEALFEYCVIRNNGSSNVSAAITYSNSNPVIRYCVFRENSRAAVGSGSNVTGSPKIMYSEFIHNTTDNSNRPQLNLGPGGEDTLYIVGNRIEGLYTMAGGIGISNLLSTGNTTAVIENNVIINNRYGYAQTGNNISSVIRGNHLIGNNIQNLPLQGGSGLNFLGSSGNYSLVRGNVISGNLWGVTIQTTAQPDLGSEGQPGGNVFYNNGNEGITYALYNNTPNPINAVGNYWGDNTQEFAESVIVHQPDLGSLGLVTYMPIHELHPVVEGFAFLASENENLAEDVYGIIDNENFSIDVEVPFETDVTNLIPQVFLPLGATSEPETGTAQDFSLPVVYTITVPHGEQQWTINATISEPPVYSLYFTITDGQEPLTDALVTLNDQVGQPGEYVFNDLHSGTYSYLVERSGYEPAEGEVEIIDTDLTVNIALTLITYSATFVITNSDGQAIDDAIITINDQTAEAGNYLFEGMIPGSYAYSVSATGYFDATGTANIVDSDLQLVVEMIVDDTSVPISDENNRLIIYPNPVVGGSLSLESPFEGESQIRITDITGKVVFSSATKGHTTMINTGDLHPGIYLIFISQKGLEVSEKIIIE